MLAAIALRYGRGNDALFHVVVHHRGGEQLLFGCNKRSQGGIDIREQLVHVQIDCRNVAISGQVQVVNEFDVLRFG